MSKLACKPLRLVCDIRLAIFVSRFIGIVGSLLFTSGIAQKAICPTLNIFRIDFRFFEFPYGFVVHLFHC